MRNPFAMLPGGKLVAAEEAEAFPNQDYGCRAAARDCS